MQKIVQVAEEFKMPPLIRRNGDGVYVFLNRGADNLGGGAIVTEVNHLDTGGLQNAPDDIDRHIMPIEK